MFPKYTEKQILPSLNMVNLGLSFEQIGTPPIAM